MQQNSRLKRLFLNIYSYTIIYALFGVLSAAYSACMIASLSTLEKRYRFSSSAASYIMITDNIATILSNLFVGYYGKTAHKPRWMSIGCFITGLSVIISAFPYFIFGAPQEFELQLVANRTISKTRTLSDQMCMNEVVKKDCSDVFSAEAMTIIALILFGTSNFFRGIGTSVYFTYGAPYLDDNISKAKVPTFFAFIFAARIFGGPIGFGLQSVALKYYENPFGTPPHLSDSDPRWIGAWWIGFLVTGTMMLLLAIPLAFFPREFKKKDKKSPVKTEAPEAIELISKGALATSLAKQRAENEQKALAKNQSSSNTVKRESDLESKKSDEDDDEQLSLKKIPAEILKILSNPLIICQMFGNLFRGIGIIGYFVFQTRYIESQFRVSARKASLVAGTTGIMAKIVGVMFGGIFISLFQPNPRRLTTFIFLVEITSVFSIFMGASVLGPQYEYPTIIKDSYGQVDLNNDCNRNCHCDNMRYQPVCEHDAMRAYFSPCHAGCKNSYRTIDGGSSFTECRCIDSPTKFLEKCDSGIEKLMDYASIIAIGSMISGLSRSGNMITFFRSINPKQKSLAVAVNSFWHSLFVSIPYPIIYGRLFDYYCLVWNRDCNKRGNCWLYDSDQLRIMYHTLSIGLIALGSVFDFIMIFLSPRLGNLYEEENVKKTFKDRLLFWRKKPKKSDGNEETEEKRQISGNIDNSIEPAGQKPKLRITDL